MKKRFLVLAGLLLTLGMATTGCGGSSGANEADPGGQEAVVSEPDGETETAVSEFAEEEQDSTEGSGSEAEENDSGTDAAELTVRFGANGEPFAMRLEDNSTAAAIAGYVGTSSWNLPIYSYDESDVMEYYDIPSRYDIPDNSETVTQAHTGEVFYSDPNRIVLYYADAEIDEEYTLIGTFDATEEFIDAVMNNPVLEGWGNQIVVISDGE